MKSIINLIALIAPFIFLAYLVFSFTMGKERKTVKQAVINFLILFLLGFMPFLLVRTVYSHGEGGILGGLTSFGEMIMSLIVLLVQLPLAIREQNNPKKQKGTKTSLT